MEEYPEELRTPPVPLISLVGCPEMHTIISTQLHSEQPPINTLALPDFSKISIMTKKKDSDGGSPMGILKKDWLMKHRTKVPAVVAALFASNHVSGDPSQWVELCNQLDQLKGVIRARNIKLLLVIVQSYSGDDINEDHMLALRKRAEVDSKYIIIFPTYDAYELKRSLNRLGSSFAELVNIYYRDEGRRVKTRVEKRSFNSIELGIRYCFKVAVYAEFRRDWVEALKFYEEAYQTLREMVGTSTRLPPIQRLVEIKTVAEQLHFKISTLLLHGGKIAESIMCFRQHCASYRRLVGAPEVTFLHWQWMSRQFLVFAELLETSSKSVPGFSSLVSGVVDKALTDLELQPAYYYQLASHYLKEKRSSLELALSLWDGSDEVDDTAESVVPSIFVGQFARLFENDDAITMQALKDEEFVCYALAEGKRYQDSFEIIALLKKSFEIYTGLKALRMASYCGFQMAKEYFSLGELKNTKHYFDIALSLYRHEGWATLLWEILGYLRECSRQDGSLKEFVEYSLEMSALPVSTDDSFAYKECGPAGPPSLQQRETILNEVLALVNQGPGVTSNGDDNSLRVTEGSPLHLEIDLVSPLRVALLASVAFNEQAVKLGTSTPITLSLLSRLPLAVEVDALEIQFNQSECNFVVLNARKSAAASPVNQQGHRAESAPDLELTTNKWLRLTYDVKSDRSGKLECVSIIVRIGSHATICCRAESSASMDDLPLWKFEERVESSPTKDPALAFYGQKAIQVEEPDPQIDLSVDASSPALVGESFIIPVTVTSKGHSVYSGELKVNLVDTRGGGLVSPREMEPYANDSHHVELLGVSGPDGEDRSQVGSDNIRKIQHSFGLISIPFLDNRESWSCQLEIRWHRPKPIMLYVSLSYSPQSDDLNAHKVHVHKSLQIEGKTPVAITHRLMHPFRRDALLLSRVKSPADSDKPGSLPQDETSVLIVSAKNCTEVPLRILSMAINEDDDALGRSCTVHPANDKVTDPSGPALLVPGEEYKKVFSVIPIEKSSKVRLGTVHLIWVRDATPLEQQNASVTGVVMKHRLPDADVELSPLVVSLECPPYAVLGDPFTYFIKVQNQTELLQEIKFLLVDSPSFVSAGSHNDTIFILPRSEKVLSYQVVPLASGSQQLPRVTLTAVRYSAGFQPSAAAATIFVFPAKPQFEAEVAQNRPEPVILAAE